jgi:hypothetical protein
LKAATIEFDGSAITCLVRDLSITGAALDITSLAGIPEHFIVAFRADAVHMRCHVVGFRENRNGVAFE